MNIRNGRLFRGTIRQNFVEGPLQCHILANPCRNRPVRAATRSVESVPGRLPRQTDRQELGQMCKGVTRYGAHDIKDLVEKGILVPQQGRVCDVFYGIRCNDSILVVPMPEEP